MRKTKIFTIILLIIWTVLYYLIATDIWLRLVGLIESSFLINNDIKWINYLYAALIVLCIDIFFMLLIFTIILHKEEESWYLWTFLIIFSIPLLPILIVIGIIVGMILGSGKTKKDRILELKKSIKDKQAELDKLEK
ncbi:hypothetical protein RRG49_02920 [Mycoplasmopsis felis]|uniref:hypothetical protein n=1 Tax=Mycoplasmopsis felis TaxID=33923 RepID=UPI0021AE5FA9|nr:hypothetical protein [Mycoplasmopsis felis]MCU9931649.1 hypothetical protein [Mycoplasmopsis felis]MCU9937655.1 hypothetical protein [Mycoplasmopsis felis]UWV84064.1 hypothetical protein NWE58_00800 [Mycoplasmopsis felis]UWW00670.1 hypothetical protein NW064_05690 [Mycoplasmopsis felis]WQQ09136.1 hypothetical protein RRG41_03310 [Mycoplasmopsis felis]